MMGARGTDFNPRSPHGERPYSSCPPRKQNGFQSTLPARGATCIEYRCSYIWTFQSTLPARGATYTLISLGRVLEISIHAPRTGSDIIVYTFKPSRLTISIHAPRTGSDKRKGRVLQYFLISIHAPRTGSDNARAVSHHF